MCRVPAPKVLLVQLPKDFGVATRVFSSCCPPVEEGRRNDRLLNIYVAGGKFLDLLLVAMVMAFVPECVL